MIDRLTAGMNHGTRQHMETMASKQQHRAAFK